MATAYMPCHGDSISHAMATTSMPCDADNL